MKGAAFGVFAARIRVKSGMAAIDQLGRQALRLRLWVEESIETHGPAHAPTHTVCLTTQPQTGQSPASTSAVVSAPRLRDARAAAQRRLAGQLALLTGPPQPRPQPFPRAAAVITRVTDEFERLARREGLVGVDFEGCPPVLVQVAAGSRVCVTPVGDAAAQRLLRCDELRHVVFGFHEAGMVANPVDAQQLAAQRWPLPWGKKDWSLSQAFSLACSEISGHDVVFVKNTEIHSRVDWSDWETLQLDEEALAYAASDALAHRFLGCCFLERFQSAV